VQRISGVKVNGELTGQIAVGLLVPLGLTHAAAKATPSISQKARLGG
jgi:hypothetical protein